MFRITLYSVTCAFVTRLPFISRDGRSFSLFRHWPALYTQSDLFFRISGLRQRPGPTDVPRGGEFACEFRFFFFFREKIEIKRKISMYSRSKGMRKVCGSLRVSSLMMLRAFVYCISRVMQI